MKYLQISSRYQGNEGRHLTNATKEATSITYEKIAAVNRV
jgi:hypothetical protein